MQTIIVKVIGTNTSLGYDIREYSRLTHASPVTCKWLPAAQYERRAKDCIAMKKEVGKQEYHRSVCALFEKYYPQTLNTNKLVFGVDVQ